MRYNIQTWLITSKPEILASSDMDWLQDINTCQAWLETKIGSEEFLMEPLSEDEFEDISSCVRASIEEAQKAAEEARKAEDAAKRAEEATEYRFASTVEPFSNSDAQHFFARTLPESGKANFYNCPKADALSRVGIFMCILATICWVGGIIAAFTFARVTVSSYIIEYEEFSYKLFFIYLSISGVGGEMFMMFSRICRAIADIYRKVM